MKKFKLSMLILMSMLVLSACGGGGGGSDDPGNPGDPDDPNYTIEIRPANGTLYLNCEYEFFAVKENDSKHLDNITWEVDDASAAKIDDDGKLTPLKAGKFKVTGTTGEGEIGMAECTVTSVAVSDVFESSSGAITKYKGSDTDVAVPASINGVGINKIGESAFSGCSSLENIEIPTSVTSIGRFAFARCTNLESIVIPAGITFITYKVFSLCASLKSIKIPASVKYIDGNPFSGCDSLKDIEVDSLNVNFEDINGVLFNKAGDELLAVPDQCISNGTYLIPTNVWSIGENAFQSCSSLKSIDIPSGVLSIEMYPFLNCSNLETVRVYAANPPLAEGHAAGLFSSGSNLTKIEVPSASVAKYKSADGWEDYATMIVGF